MNRSRLQWYWHRLRAMSAGELLHHALKKGHEFRDARRPPKWSQATLDPSGPFPRSPEASRAPEAVRVALARDTEHILAGRWRAFGHLPIKVDGPPRWHCDYLANQDLATEESAFRLNHRALPGGTEIKLIWELSRWHPLVRLAMAAYVLQDRRAADTCLAWLEDWVKHNPPYRGWNWISALETGLRLVNFAWMDALLAGAAQAGACTPHKEEPLWPRPFPSAEGTRLPTTDTLRTPLGSSASADAPDSQILQRLKRLRGEILPAHVWHTWRHRSFGSSANNHLLGELAGLIVAAARWPAVERWAAPLHTLHRQWEREVLAQFAEDGGNREQALHYHLFSWELCWQTWHALRAAGRDVSLEVCRRLRDAADFYVKVQAENDPWDYGDSDGAYVTPFFASDATATREWRQWMMDTAQGSAIDFWLGAGRQEFAASYRRHAGWQPEKVVWSGRGTAARPEADWLHYPHTGQLVARVGEWMLRWDLSPLGYLKTAAHGHLDALHVSIWLKDTALVIDPGTGAYYADAQLRQWLASRAAHNGPCPEGPEWPRRLGPFLWGRPHPPPTVERQGDAVAATLELANARLRRTVTHSPACLSWQIDDVCISSQKRPVPFSVRWQFAPGCWAKMLGPRKFALHRADVSLVIELSDAWSIVRFVGSEAGRGDDDSPLAGVVSPAFRRTTFAPYLLLKAMPGDRPCVFRTTFLASAGA